MFVLLYQHKIFKDKHTSLFLPAEITKKNSFIIMTSVKQLIMNPGIVTHIDLACKY
jgi:hypothetical protein